MDAVAQYKLINGTHPTADIAHPAAVLAASNGRRYLFGKVPEGLQRALSRAEAKMGKIESVFLTGDIGIHAVGGLAGLILTAADRGVSRLQIVSGSSDMEYACATWRTFVFRKGLQLETSVAQSGVGYTDGSILVIPVMTNSGAAQGNDGNISGNFDVISGNNSSLPSASSASSASFTHLSTNSIPTNPSSDTLRPIIQSMFPDGTTNTIHNADVDSDGELPETLRSEEEAMRVNARPLPLTVLTRTATSYIVSFRPARGKFLRDKAVALGVPPGPLFRRLVSGESVELPSGAVVRPEDVVEPPRRYLRVLVVDCPDAGHMEEIVAFPRWRLGAEVVEGGVEIGKEGSASASTSLKPTPIRFTSDSEEIGIVYHFLGATVDPLAPQYLNWMASFGPKCRHIVSHPKFSPNTINYHSAARLSFQLNRVKPEVYSYPKGNAAEADFATAVAEALAAHPVAGLTAEMIEVMDSTSEYNVLPGAENADPVRGNAPPVADSEYYAGILAEDCRSDSIEVQKLEDPPEFRPDCQEFPENGESETGEFTNVEVLTLGTGSALPSDYRNVSGTIVRIPSNVEKTNRDNSRKFRSVVLDCGENTLGTLRRNYGIRRSEQLLAEIEVLFLSHLHADHHLGFVSLIKAWTGLQNRQGTNKRLLMIAPPQYQYFLQEWAQLEPKAGLEFVDFVSCADLLVRRGSAPNWDTETVAQLKERGISVAQTVRAIHCMHSYSLIMEMTPQEKLPKQENPGFRFAYSGDTRPNAFFARVAFGVDLLVHEATLDDALRPDAVAKRHSTFTEALDVAQQMQASYTVLTHFSQRYPKLPNSDCVPSELIEAADELEFPPAFLEAVGKDLKNQLNVAYAFDGMRMRLKDVAEQKKYRGLLEEVMREAGKWEAEESGESKEFGNSENSLGNKANTGKNSGKSRKCERKNGNGNGKKIETQSNSASMKRPASGGAAKGQRKNRKKQSGGAGGVGCGVNSGVGSAVEFPRKSVT